MQGGRMRTILLACLLVSCRGNDRGANPPSAPVARTMPPALAVALPHTPDGRPILIQTNSLTTPDERIALAYDDKLDDPVVRYGWCLERVAACYHTNRPPIARCIDLIEKCSSDEGGVACCAPACVREFHRQLTLGRTEMRAIAESFVRGDCQAGLTAARSGP